MNDFKNNIMSDLEARELLKKTQKYIPIDDKMVQLALMWCKGEIRITHICDMLGVHNANTIYQKIAKALAKYIKDNNYIE